MKAPDGVRGALIPHTPGAIATVEIVVADPVDGDAVIRLRNFSTGEVVGTGRIPAHWLRRTGSTSVMIAEPEETPR